jgi:hypothetical protein
VIKFPGETPTAPPWTVLITPSKVMVVRAWTAKFPNKLWETDSQPGLENELDVGEVVGRDVAILL